MKIKGYYKMSAGGLSEAESMELSARIKSGEFSHTDASPEVQAKRLEKERRNEMRAERRHSGRYEK